MNKAERKHLDRVANMGCLICGAPASIHHPRFACGMSQRSNHWFAIPLCKFHHQDGPFGQAIHNGCQEFERNHMSEVDMLAEVIRRISK